MLGIIYNINLARRCAFRSNFKTLEMQRWEDSVHEKSNKVRGAGEDKFLSHVNMRQEASVQP